MSYIGTQPTPQSLESRQEFTATASQTTFATSGYTVGYVDVYLNGVKLSTSDFTATNGSDVVLGSGAAAGDVLAVVMKNDHSDLVALPITDSQGNNVLSESGSVVTLTADEANVGSNALVVDSSGNVGIGTSSPTQRLQVDGGAFRVTGDYSVIVSNQGLLLGFNSASDEARYYAVGANGGGVGEHVFYSYNYSTGAGSERMRIDSSGALILAGSTAQKATGTAWSNPSDQRLKSNISDYPKGTAELMQVRVREWEYNGKGGTVAGTKGLGVVADEIMTVLPNTVDNYEAKLNVDDEETTQIKKFDATEITWLLVKTTQEQQTIIESQQSQIDALTARIEALETPAE